METEDGPDLNQGFQHAYDDDEHDSDIEARLYAEVYYSNTIIGEENNTNNSIPQNQCPDTSVDSNESSSNNQKRLCAKNRTNQNSNGNITCDSNVVTLNGSTNTVIVNAKNINAINISKESASVHNSKKRTFNNCLDDANKSRKRRKNDNRTPARGSQTKQCNELSSELESNKQKNNTVECDGNTLINPYSKNALAKKQKSMKLLSPEFISLFFPGKSRKKKKTDYPVKQDRHTRTSKCNVTPNFDTMQPPSNTKPVETNLEIESATKSAVIDISSDSSNESFVENDSKYSIIVATDKKLKERESGLKSNCKHNASDSEESIFEVPVPPKPAPQVIEVNDSDNERENQIESDEDNFLNNLFISEETVIENDHVVSLDSTMNQAQDTCEIISDNDDSNSLVLNCTPFQNGVSSLDEIKNVNQQTLNAIQRSPDTSNSNNILQHSQHKSGLSNNPTVIGKSPTSLQNKQRSKVSSKNIPEAEYFFQPMNEKMKSFYNNSWGGENFDMDKMKSNMSTDSKKWAILNKDLVITGPRKKRYFGMSCAKCHKDGHKQNNCPEPNKGPTCYMCGATGHFATYCPHTKCLTCGRKQTMYRTTCGYCEKLYCTRCRSQGHKNDSCPDLWRRYHHTTNGFAPKIPFNVNNVLKSKNELFCCNCTRQGHDSMDCRKLRWSQHFANPSFVTHYSGPTYSAVTNFNASPIVDDMRKNPRNVYNKFDNSSTCNNLISNSVISNRVSTNFSRSGKRNENGVQNKLNGTLNVSDSHKNIIFKISGLKIKSSEETKTIRSVTMKLDIPDKSDPESIEKWKKLSDFLKELVSYMSAEFRLEEKDKQLFMYIKYSNNNIANFLAIIKQYASRTDFERSQMLLSGERTLKVVLENLSRKFVEMKNLNGDILTLYEEIRQLRQELDKDKNEIHNRSKLNELASLQENLLMLLYREGFGDESLGQLRKLYLRMQKITEQRAPNKRNLKKSYKDASGTLMTFKMLFTYLYNYNNIFVSYNDERLGSYIQKYKDNLDKRNKLLNSTQKNNYSTDATIHNDISNEKVLSEDSSKALPPTSVEQSNLQSVTTETSVATINDKHNNLNSDSMNQILISTKPKTKKKLNSLYLQAMKTKNQNHKENLMQNFRNFLKNTRNCLERASKLNLPRLHDDIVNLQRELEDETHLSVNKVRKFKKKVRDETLRLHGGIKKHKINSNADNIYKNFCASL